MTKRMEKGRCDMKVWELLNMITDGDTAVVVDRNTDEVIFNEVTDIGCDDKYFKCKDLEVVGVSTNKADVVNVYVNAFKTYHTYLDVTYTTEVVLTIPISDDKDDEFQKRGKELIELLPKEMQFGEVNFSRGFNSMENGVYYDVIEECER